MTRILDRPRYSRWTWIVAILLALLLLLLWWTGHGPGAPSACCGTPQAVAPPQAVTPAPKPVTPPPAPATVPAPAPKAAGSLSFAIQDGKLVLEGVAPDQATKDAWLKAAFAAYGEANVIDRLKVDGEVTASKCADQLDRLFAALKAAPQVGFACEAEALTLTGTVASGADKAAREQWARDFFGAGWRIVNRIEVVTPVAKAEDVRCSDKIAAAVTFATGSERIDVEGGKLLDAVAPCLKDGTYEISGHTDNVGSAEVNVPLSKSRAEAVRAYLIHKGVAGDRLSAVGYGADRPIADNSSAEGRAQNRRIEFAKK